LKIKINKYVFKEWDTDMGMQWMQQRGIPLLSLWLPKVFGFHLKNHTKYIDQ